MCLVPFFSFNLHSGKKNFVCVLIRAGRRNEAIIIPRPAAEIYYILGPKNPQEIAAMAGSAVFRSEVEKGGRKKELYILGGPGNVLFPGNEGARGMVHTGYRGGTVKL